MADTPDFLNDADTRLTEDGFVTNNIWYHGTSSALVTSINDQGLKRSGDAALNEAAKKTMATIGNDYTESIEPVFLTPSKTLAYYWAQQTVRNRSVRIKGDEKPVVLEVNLPDELNAKVKPDVGAASLLLIEDGEKFLAYLAGMYEAQGLAAPEINLMKADRQEYLQKLGMAYFDADIAPEYVTLIEG